MSQLSCPIVAAPMFLISGPELVIACCTHGVVGTFPALNQRSTQGFADWVDEIQHHLTALSGTSAPQVAPFGVNLIVHRTNPRLHADLSVCVQKKVPLVITSLGAVKEVVDAIHSYGGLVFHDVTNLKHAKKAIAAGVDGLIAVSAGAGGHAGTLNPFAFVSELRAQFEGFILLAGCINHGHQVLAAQAMGADLAYMGTRFINTSESRADPKNKEMICSSVAEDILYTPAISGIPASFLIPSLSQAGLDIEKLRDWSNRPDIDLGKEMGMDESDKKAWKDIWSAGQGVGTIDDCPSTSQLIERLRHEYQQAVTQWH